MFKRLPTHEERDLFAQVASGMNAPGVSGQSVSGVNENVSRRVENKSAVLETISSPRKTAYRTPGATPWWMGSSGVSELTWSSEEVPDGHGQQRGGDTCPAICLSCHRLQPKHAVV